MAAVYAPAYPPSAKMRSTNAKRERGPLEKMNGCMSAPSVGRKHNDVRQKSKRVNEDVALSSVTF